MTVRHRPPRSGFTLIELLIVIGILGVLMAATVIVGVKIVGSGKKRVTEGVVKALDTSLSAYVHSQERIPPPVVTDPRDSSKFLPVADAVIGDPPPPALVTVKDPPVDPFLINSVGLYMLQCQAVPDADAIIKGLDAKLVRLYAPQSSSTGGGADTQPQLMTVFDGWDRPVRYVHPSFKGVIGGVGAPVDVATPGAPSLVSAPTGKTSNIVKVRRTSSFISGAAPNDQVCDADGGLISNNRPYFFSSGDDKRTGYIMRPPVNPGNPYEVETDWNQDNVYSGPNPQYQK